MNTKSSFYYKVLFYSLVAFIITFGSSRSFGYEWSKTFGGSNDDRGWEVQQTTDGGFIVVGWTRSFGAGDWDVWLIKTDANGAELWNKTYGGSDTEDGNSVQQTTDGGFIVAGSTVSFGAGWADGYLIKTDANGNELWSKTYGGVAGDWINSVRQTSDGGYAMIGETNNFGASGSDVWLVKTDADGNELWSKTFGDTGDDNVQNFDQTNDGGFIFAMYEGITTAPEKTSIILTKTDGNGNQMWSKTFGPATLYQWGSWVHQTTDGGYIISGGNVDFYLIKTDANGNELWSKTYGGSNWELGREAQQTSDGGYIMVGRTESFGAGSEDAYLIKTDANGNELWSKTYGGIDSDWGRSVKQTANGGYIFTGKTCSFGAGGCDVYLVYYKPEDNVNNHVTFEPDPSTYLFVPDPEDCQTGAVGKFSFDAKLTNVSEKELSNLYVEVDELTNNNLLLTDNGLIGEGGRFEVTEIDDYSDGYLSPDEFVDVPFIVCLQQKKPFRLFVNVLGAIGPLFNPKNEHYYQLVEVSSGLNWYEAKDAAAASEYKGLQGHLATFTSLNEETLVVSNFPQIVPNYVWLGATDEAVEGDWKWITGEPWSYTNWDPGEPNGGTSENCLDYSDGVDKWNDESCSRKINFYLLEYSADTLK
jgi:hypothetical protein